MEYNIVAKAGGKYDVIVCGGGTAGVAAAIAAARAGSKTLLLERTFTVGGMLTLGDAGITKFSEHCRDAQVYKAEVLDVLGTNPRSVQVAGGIPHEYVMRMMRQGGALGTRGDAGSYVFTDRYCAQWTLMDMLQEAGVEVLYDTSVCLARMEGNTIRGVVAHNKEGFVEFLADCVIDATGDADVAALAGVAFHKGVSETDLWEGCGNVLGQMMAFGTMFRVRGVDYSRLYDYLEAHPERFWQHEFGVMTLENARQSHENGEMSVMRVVVDLPEGKTGLLQVYNMPARDEAVLLGPYCGYEGDGLDGKSISRGQEALQRGVQKLMSVLKDYPGFENARVMFVPDVGVRETRHIVGKYVMTGLDVVAGRDFADSIACGGHPVDVHPLPPEVEHMPMNHWRFHIPYRILVPETVENLLVAGRCVSATRMASGSLRTTVQCMATGEATGLAAAMSAAAGISPAAIDVAALQERLKRAGAIL